MLGQAMVFVEIQSCEESAGVQSNGGKSNPSCIC